MGTRAQGQRAARMRWARYDRTKLPPSAAKDPTQRAAAKRERRAIRNRPGIGESFAAWFFANPDRIFLNEPYEELRSLPRGCRGCEEPVEKPGEWCGACAARGYRGPASISDHRRRHVARGGRRARGVDRVAREAREIARRGAVPSLQDKAASE